jgi:hypothetical protein
MSEDKSLSDIELELVSALRVHGGDLIEAAGGIMSERASLGSANSYTLDKIDRTVARLAEDLRSFKAQMASLKEGAR